MTRGKRSHTPLPPPVGMVLRYAADGLALKLGHTTPKGRPRPLDPSLWINIVRQLIHSVEGLKVLRELAIAGMHAWHIPEPDILFHDHVFREVTFRALALAALANLERGIPSSQHKLNPAKLPYPVPSHHGRQRPKQQFKMVKAHSTQLLRSPHPKPQHAPHDHKPA